MNAMRKVLAYLLCALLFGGALMSGIMLAGGTSRAPARAEQMEEHPSEQAPAQASDPAPEPAPEPDGDDSDGGAKKTKSKKNKKPAADAEPDFDPEQSLHPDLIQVLESQGGAQDEPAPKEAEPKEIAPAETEPDEPAPAETEPEETDPVETAPEETGPEEMDGEEVEPKEAESGEIIPEEIIPDAIAPGEIIPEEIVSEDIVPEDIDLLLEMEGEVLPDGELLEDMPLSELDPGSVSLGATPQFTAQPGGSVTLAIPVVYHTSISHYDPETDSFDSQEMTFATNAVANDEGTPGDILSYSASTPTGAYDQEAITAILDHLYVKIADAQPPSCPLDLSDPQPMRALVAAGVNNGYAVFDDVPLQPDLAPGNYPVALHVQWENEEGDARSADVTLLLSVTGGDPVLHGENGIIVFTHAQLKSALQDSVPGYDGHSFDPVYLGSCMTAMPDGSWETQNNGTIRYPTSTWEDPSIAVARNATIIGTDPRTGTRLTVIDQIPSGSDFGTEREYGMYTSAPGITITVRDVTWNGYNYNGIVNGVHQGGTQYINVNYYGCRMHCSDAAGSWVSLTNCTATIVDMDSTAAQGREVACCGDIRLYGENIIKRTAGEDSKSILRSGVFAIVVSPHKFTVAKGANVSATANGHFLRMGDYAEIATVAIKGTLDVATQSTWGAFGSSVGYIGDMTVSGSLQIEDTGNSMPCLSAANLNVPGSLTILDRATSDGASKAAALRVEGSLNVSGSLQIESYLRLPKRRLAALYAIGPVDISGSLKIVDYLSVTGGDNYYGTLYCDGMLTVSGSLYIEHKNALTKPCIRFTDGNTMTFDSPKRIDLKARGGTVIATRSGICSLVMTTQVINVELSSGAKRIWNNKGLEPFSVEVKFPQQTNGTTPSGLDDSKGAALTAVVLNTTNFDFGKMTRLLLGQYAATIDASTVFRGSDVIRGSAPSGSSQTVREYYRPSMEQVQSVQAHGSTSYQTGEDWKPISSADARIYLLSKQDDLEVHIYRDVIEMLELQSVPSMLDFGVIPITGHQRTLSPTGDQLVQVADTRPNSSWTLYLSATPMTSEGGAMLENALAFLDTDGAMTPLSAGGSVQAAEKPAGAPIGITDVSWPEGGIRLMLMPFQGEPNVSYSATITWTLEDT